MSANRDIGDADYHADLDLDLDGDATFGAPDSPTDLTLSVAGMWFQAALPDGWISDPSSSTGPDNSVGYAGYVHNPEREDYTVRFRVYEPRLGRWRQRDAHQYADGSSQYEYVQSDAVGFVDPMGLSASLPDDQWGRPGVQPGQVPGVPSIVRIPSRGNCYRFVCNDPVPPGNGVDIIKLQDPNYLPSEKDVRDYTNHGREPGGKLPKYPTCQDLIDGALADGMCPPDDDGECPEGTSKVVFALDNAKPGDGSQGGSFHAWKQNPDGSWSDKDGFGPVTNSPHDPREQNNRPGYPNVCPQALCVSNEGI